MTAYQVVHEAPELDAVPAALRAVVEPCLDKDPDARPSADQLLERLRDLPNEMGDAAEVRGSRTRDVDTQHHQGSSLGGGAVGGPTNSPRPRRRWRPVLAAAVAVAALGGGIAALQLGSSGSPSPDGGDGDGKDRTVAAAEAPLPSGYRPWRTTVPNDKGIPDEVRCVPRGDALFCGGGGVLATRLRISDGKEIWKVKSPGVPMQGMHIVGATDDTVLGYRIPPEAASSDEPVKLVALDARTSKELWSRPISGQSQIFTGRSQDAVISGSTVLSVDPGRTRVEARDVHSGRTLWTTPFPAGSECTPVPAGQRMYAMCAPAAQVANIEVRNPVLRTVDLTSGTFGKGIAVAGPVHPVGGHDGRLVLLHQRMNGPEFLGYDKVLRVEPGSGRVSSRPLGKVYGATPGMANGTVYFAEQTGRISAVDPVTGRQKWSRQTGVEGTSGPTASGGTLYFSSASGRVVALSPQGKTLWTTDPRADGLAGEVNASPRVAVSGRVVVVAAAKNTVFSFDATKPPKSG